MESDSAGQMEVPIGMVNSRDFAIECFLDLPCSKVGFRQRGPSFSWKIESIQHLCGHRSLDSPIFYFSTKSGSS